MEQLDVRHIIGKVQNNPVIWKIRINFKNMSIDLLYFSAIQLLEYNQDNFKWVEKKCTNIFAGFFLF